MSTYLTKIPVDLAGIKAQLPPDSDIEGVSWNGAEIELTWSNRHLLTPFTYAHEWTLDQLKSGKRPLHVSDRQRKPAPPPVQTQKANVVDGKGKRVRRQSATL